MAEASTSIFISYAHADRDFVQRLEADLRQQGPVPKSGDERMGNICQSPVGMVSLVTWVQATGLQPDDLARYEQHQRRIRVVVPERLRGLLQARKDDGLLPMRLVEM